LAFWAAFVAWGLVACDDDEGPSLGVPDRTSSAGLSLNERSLRATVVGGAVEVELPLFRPNGGGKAWGHATVTLYDLSGEELSEAEVDFTFPADVRQLRTTVSGLTGVGEAGGPGDLAQYVVRYEAQLGRSRVSGARSLYEMAQRIGAVVLGSDELFEGQSNQLRVTARDPSGGQPVATAAVEVFLETTDSEGQTTRSSLWAGTTDDHGVAQATFTPRDHAGPATLIVFMQKEGQSAETRHAVTIQRSHRILLTTDKPLYQPGQTMHLRALSFRLPDNQPSADAAVVFEVVDAKGNTVFREETEANDFGVAATEFRLARMVNMGQYTIRATVDEALQERTVTVDRYALPRFRVDLATDQSFYLPGEELRGQIDVEYIFGEPVAGGSVRVRASQFDVGWVEFNETLGTTDGEGHFDFALTLPNYFVGLPLEQGGSFVKLDIDVEDTAGQTSTVSRSITVARGAVTVTLVPERRQLAPGVANRIFLLTADPTGAPLSTRCTVQAGSEHNFVVETDERGFVSFEVTPVTAEPLTVEVEADDGRGGVARGQQTFTAQGTEQETVLLRTDRSLYNVGDTAELTIYSPRAQDRVYLDAVRHGQTVLTDIVSVEDGWTTVPLDLADGLAGSVTLSVYYLADGGDIVRDQRVIYVAGAGELGLRMQLDQSEYLPAETARLQLTVTTPAGTGVQAAVGLQVVDEAVFALSEQQPGLERVYFMLEQELAQPSYEVHGFDSHSLFAEGDPDRDDARAQEAAEVLFAASDHAAFGINYGTEREVVSVVLSHTRTALSGDLDELEQLLTAYLEDLVFGDAEDSAAYWVRISRDRWFDPWGQRYRASFTDEQLTLSSAGVDEIWDTEDDVTVSRWINVHPDRMWAADGDMDNAGPPLAAGGSSDEGGGDRGGSGGSGGEPPRIRQWFPETLYVNPSVITDENGRAAVDIPLADSITTWRASAIASSRLGALASGTTGIRVFQDFFVDLALPATMTLGDEITVPVVVYNYLDEAQTVTVEVTDDDWFTLLSPATQSLSLAAREVSSVPLRIRVDRVGWHDLQAVGRAGSVADGLRRRIEVMPSGLVTNQAQSDVLEGSADGTRVAFSFDIPAGAVAEASELLVKLYPGVFAQAIEGLDSILRMPSGCFEQTSSSTYPNIMVLQYLQESGTTTPEIEMRAREYINLGYQRLLTFEVDGGGFEWFGNPPAHKILTAYGLMEFADMAAVHPVDPAVISRTANWLASQQEGDGSWTPDEGGIAEGAINNYQNSTYRTTAYILWALLEAGYSGAEVSRAVSYLRAHSDEATNSYSRAIAAQALVSHDPSDSVADALLARLADDAVVENEAASWGDEAGASGMTYSMGSSHVLETTSLVIDAFLRAGRYPNLVSQGLTYLVRSKDSFGNWETTQATVYALRAMIRSMSSSATTADGTVEILHNGSLVETLTITAADSDVFRQVDLKELIVEPGANLVELVMTGTGSIMYQTVGTYWMPWSEVPEEPVGDLSIFVAYDRTSLSVDDTVTADVTVANNTAGSLMMVMVDLGIAPGFELVTDDLNQLMADGLFLRYETTQRQLLIYFGEIQAGPPVTFSYRMVARNPMRGEAPAASAYLYYEPSVRTTDTPIALEVD
jgi:hypothetical protein